MTRVGMLKAIVICSVLLPWISMSAGLPSLRPEWFVILTGLTFLRVLRRALISPAILWVAFVFGSYCVSMYYGLAVLGVDVTVRDFTEFLKPVLYALTFVLAASGSYSVKQLHGFLRVVILALSASAVVAIFQFLSPATIAPLLRLWADDARIIDYARMRATGTMGNANDLGFLMVVSFGVVLFASEHRVLRPWLARPLVALNFLAVFASGSRTAIVCLAITIGTYLLLEMRMRVRQVAMVGTLTLASYVLFQRVVLQTTELQLLAGRLLSFGTVGEDAAFQSRMFAAMDTWPYILESWLFGHGPAKAIFALGTNVDNEYVLTLYRSGLLGLVATVGLVWILARGKGMTAVNSGPLASSMQHFASASVVAAGVFAYTAGFFMSMRLVVLLTTIWTVVFRVTAPAGGVDAYECRGYRIGAPETAERS